MTFGTCVQSGVVGGDHETEPGDGGAPGGAGGGGGVVGGAAPGGGGGGTLQLGFAGKGSSLLSRSDALHVVRVASFGGLSSLH